MKFDIACNAFVLKHLKKILADDGKTDALYQEFLTFCEAPGTTPDFPQWPDAELLACNEKAVLSRLCAIVAQQTTSSTALPTVFTVRLDSNDVVAIRKAYHSTKRRIADEYARSIVAARYGRAHAGAPLWQGFARSALDHVIETRKVLAEDLRNLTHLMLVVLVAFGTLTWYGIQATNVFTADALFVAAAAVATFAYVTTYAAAAKATASYSFYSAATLHAAICYRAFGLDDCHEWLSNIERYIRELDIRGRTSTPEQWKDVVRERWTDPASLTDSKSWRYCKFIYQRLIEMFPILLAWQVCRDWLQLPDKIIKEGRDTQSPVSFLLPNRDSLEDVQSHQGQNLLQVALFLIMWFRLAAILLFGTSIYLYSYWVPPSVKEAANPAPVTAAVEAAPQGGLEIEASQLEVLVGHGPPTKIKSEHAIVRPE